MTRPFARRALSHAYGRLRQRIARPHPAPVIVLGNQKSGTSAIASLLSAATGLDATIDIHGIHGDSQRAIHDGELPFERFVRQNRLDFSRPIIKEPALTFLYSSVAQEFPRAHVAFVVRDPRSNIRSILDRLGLPGNLEDVGEPELARAGRYGPNWRRMLEGWLGANGDTYIDRLAARWNIATDLYLTHGRGRWPLVRYEDFVVDKAGTIATLARQLELVPRHDIGHLLDVSFQPAGSSGVPAEVFFGRRNLTRILDACGPNMTRLGYSP